MILFTTITTVTVIFLNTHNVDEKVDLILHENLLKLKIHYKSLLHHQEKIANTFYEIVISKKGFVPLFSQISQAQGEEKKRLREKLKVFVSTEYAIMKKEGIVQFQIILANNESFLRMNNPALYGDDLGLSREDILFTNTTHTISRGLVQGKNLLGFRNVYPIFDKEKNYLGAVEISFTSEKFQNNLTTISDIHAHFLVHKNLLKNIDSKLGQSKYTQSSENKNYLLHLTKNHNRQICIVENKKKLQPFKKEIHQKMEKGEPFSFFTKINSQKKMEVITFLPIQSFNSTQSYAWIVSYTHNQFLYNTLKSAHYVNFLFVILILIVSLFIYKQIISEGLIKKEHTLLEDVVNTTDDIIFVTDCKSISFSNKKFETFMELNYYDSKNGVFRLFLEMKGYLHLGLLHEEETFVDLYNRTPGEDKVVCMLDSSMDPKAFAIKITKSTYLHSEYLVTLTDITKMKEKELKISHQAFRDKLTGVYNRNKFDELISIELQRDHRYKRDLSVAIVDIDHFKKFNDTYGHLIGDEVLILLAQYINTNIRETDIFARWGGEEFVILFPETTKENAYIVCEKLREGVADLEHDVAGSIHASFGITQCKEGDSIETLLKRCDDALYEAKKTGRNKTCIRE